MSMAVTQAQIDRIQASFNKITPIADQAAEIFYATLFEYDPELRKLFKNDMKKQGSMLMSMLAVAVRSLNDVEGLVPVLQRLADKHIEYGVEAKDYSPVMNALLHTLKVGLGPYFTPELRKDWIALLHVVTDVMKVHAYGEQSLRANN